MKYSENGFRTLYRDFGVFDLTDRLRPMLKDFPGIEEANCVLMYGYIDSEAGMSLEAIATGYRKDGKNKFFDSCTETRLTLRAGAIEDEEFIVLSNATEKLYTRYETKLEEMKDYAAASEVEATRTFEFLDPVRHPYYPDDIMVLIVKDGMSPECCWVTLCGLGDGYLLGKLLNEPNQPFGCHEGDRITVYLQKDEEGKVVCFSDFSETAES